MLKSKNKDLIFLSEKGISLIEVLVVIAIIGIMVAVFILVPPTRNPAKFAAEQFADDIRKFQSQSVNTKQYNSTVTSGGYGIHLDISSNNKSYTIFADKAPYNHTYDSGEEVKNIDLSTGLTAGAKIDSMKKGSAVNSVDINFIPPYGNVFIDGVENGANGIEVNFARDNGTNCPNSSCIAVNVNQQGGVSVIE